MYLGYTSNLSEKGKINGVCRCSEVAGAVRRLILLCTDIERPFPPPTARAEDIVLQG